MGRRPKRHWQGFGLLRQSRQVQEPGLPILFLVYIFIFYWDLLLIILVPQVRRSSGSSRLCMASDRTWVSRARISSTRSLQQRSAAPEATARPVPRTGSRTPSICNWRKAGDGVWIYGQFPGDFADRRHKFASLKSWPAMANFTWRMTCS